MNSPLEVRAGRFHRGRRAWRVCKVCMMYLGGLASCRLRAEAIGTRLWKAKAKWSMQVFGSSHSSDETCESRWSEGEDILFVSFDETLGPLEALLQVESEEKEIWELSGTHKRLQNLIHHVNKDSLKEEHQRQSGDKASGVDGMTKADYSRNLDANIDDLLLRMKSFSYRPKPARRS